MTKARSIDGDPRKMGPGESACGNLALATAVAVVSNAKDAQALAGKRMAAALR